MVPKRLLPGPCQVVVERAQQNRQDALAQAALDLGPVAVEHAEPESEEVVGDPVDAPTRPPRILGDRHDTLDQAQGDEPVEGAARIRAHRLLDLVEASAAGGDRVEDQTSQVASLSLGRKHQLTLGEELAARRTGETGEVDSKARALIP